jgi:archaellum component FlaC
MASQESLNDVAAAVDTKAGVDALEKFMRIVDEQFTKLQAENEGLHASITELTARIEALENPVTE